MEPNTAQASAAPTTPTATPPKAKRTRKPAAPQAQTPTDNPARDALLAKVRKGIDAAKGQSADKSLVILRDTLSMVHASAPDVELSSNKEQRLAQLKQLREARANLGWQVAARMVGDAIAKVEGVDVAHRYAARQLVNGSLVATENIRTTLKASKQHRGLSIR